jgi:hypothetical protein
MTFNRVMAIVTLGVLLSVKGEAEKMVNALKTIFRIYNNPSVKHADRIGDRFTDVG